MKEASESKNEENEEIGTMTENDTGTDVALRDAGDIDAQIKTITALAHTGRESDEAQYQTLQPKLMELVAQKAGRGVATRPATERSVAKRGEAAASEEWYQYPSLPANSDQFDQVDRAMWESALPEMRELGLTSAQVGGLAKILERASQKAVRRRKGEAESARDAAQRQSEDVLRQRYGNGWRNRLKAANDALRAARQHDKSINLADFILSDGTRLFDNAVLVSLLIDYAES